MITFTIATCTYNAAQVIDRTLQSVLRQTYPYVQHLIVDGASTDQTLQKIDLYRQESAEKETMHDIELLTEKDNGLFDAMNKALQLATGTYIVFLNAGDALPSPDTLESIANSVGDGERLPGVLYGETNIVDSEGRFLRRRRLSAPQQLSANSFLHGMVVCHQAFYALTSIAKDTPYDLRYRYSADVDWCIRIMKASEQEQRTMKNVELVVADYLEGGMSVQNHRASLMERFHIMRRHYGLFRTVGMHLWFVVRAVIRK